MIEHLREIYKHIHALEVKLMDLELFLEQEKKIKKFHLPSVNDLNKIYHDELLNIKIQQGYEKDIETYKQEISNYKEELKIAHSEIDTLRGLLNLHAKKVCNVR